MEDYQKSYSKKALNTFLEKTFEIAFGDDAINKGYTMKEVVGKLDEYNKDSFEAISLLLENFNSIEEFESKKKAFLENTVGDY